MKLVRYSFEGVARFGALEGDEIRPMAGELGRLEPERGTRPVGLNQVRLLAPVLPTKIVAIGLNYRDHAKEMGKQLPAEPLLFLKPPSAVIGPGDQIIYPPQTSRLDYEGELAVVIGRTARKVSPADARDYILGFTCMIDVTARDLQSRDVQYTRAKGFDTFAPLGPAIATDIDASDLGLETRLNGEVHQHSRTSQLIFDCNHLLSYISHVMTLMPGDVISTGTPSGVGPMQIGDVVEVEIERIGCLRSSVIAAS
jgi:2-keto-4-pentenoate hydratase/2-oxohepta-3-ene-1,7-dioic acid hydratase in catechol pathway